MRGSSSSGPSGPTFEIINNVLCASLKGKVYLGRYKVAFEPKTGKPARDKALLETSYAGMLTDSAGHSWGGADLRVFGGARKVAVHSGDLVKKKRKMVRSKDVPGSGFEIGMSTSMGGKEAPAWTMKSQPVRFNALVLTKDVVFAAGGLEFAQDMKSETPWGFLDGSQGGKLMAYATADGKVLGEIKLASMPVFDGLAAANGRGFLATIDGALTCFGNK